MSFDQFLDSLAECGSTFDIVNERLTPRGTVPSDILAKFELHREDWNRELARIPTPAECPIDWREELRLERRGLFGRILNRVDPDAKGQLISLILDRPHDRIEAEHWWKRVNEVESELRRLHRLPAYIWDVVPSRRRESAA
jgi:hypothetical protein